ncbi:hypothetical protein L6Q21_00180 [Sandaracinobacter sp. RS1-74]|uniref:hypothetical protein n=1 Tax=Sandaracinobacteroides sayramensis TaxID=2913411 RepID=UPI001EDA5CAE|nr:hypothetical protein [Sandaracinobacteroides sayramensis]
MADWFRQADRDADGRLTRDEFLADGEAYFRTLDLNGNGQLEAAEIDAYEAAVLAPLTPRPGQRAPDAKAEANAGERPMPMPASAPPRRTRPTPGAPRGAGLYGVIDIRHPVKAADQDMNSRVTAEEWRKVLNGRFAILDRQGQGYLTLETLPPTPWQTMQPGFKAKK